MLARHREMEQSFESSLTGQALSNRGWTELSDRRRRLSWIFRFHFLFLIAASGTAPAKRPERRRKNHASGCFLRRLSQFKMPLSRRRSEQNQNADQSRLLGLFPSENES
jgi:hypothetical protein